METQRVSVIHYIITAVIVFGFGYLPPFGQMTPYGMGVLGSFVGAIYGWSTIGMIWPSLVALIGLGLNIGMTNLLAASFANPVVAALFVMFPFMAVLTELHVTELVANKFLTNKLSLGRPWITIAILLLGAYICAFINSILVAIIFSTFVITMCNNLKIPPYSKLPTALLLGLAYAIMNGQIIFPFLGTGLTFTAAYNGMLGTQLPYGKFMLFIIPLGIVMVLLFVLIMRFVLRVDVSPLANLTEDMMGAKMTMTRDQKVASIFFLIFVAVMIVGSILPPTNAIAQFLNGGLTLFGIAAVFACIMMVLKDSNGKPLLDFPIMAAKGMAWDPIFMTAYIMVISAFLTTPETGVSATLASLLAPMVALPPMVFVIVAMLFATIVTNVASNIILTIILMPVLASFATQVGLSPMGLILLSFMATQMALVTPGASPITGIMFAQTTMVKGSEMSKIALMTLPFLFVGCMAVGIALMMLLF